MSRSVLRWVAGLGALALTATGCHAASRRAGPVATTTTTSASSTTTAAPTTTSASVATPTVPLPKLRLEKVAQMTQPIAAGVRPAGDGALYVASKNGRVFLLKGGTANPVLDLSAQVTKGGEQGLLGLAISPKDKLYLDLTDTNGDTRVLEYAFSGEGIDAASRREVLFVHQPYSNHNGGGIAFGPDGFLYIGLGDGGSERDPNSIGQNLGTLLAKILRIDPAPSGGKAYTVPADNPFVGKAGARPETWAYGLRNPWRFTFDRVTHDLWIGDVGQDQYEEVDHVAAGRAGVNYGWSQREALHSYKGAQPAGAVDPVAEYDHSRGCAVIGGYVYRGSEVGGLSGAYLFADSCRSDIRALVPRGSGFAQVATGLTADNIGSFGEDAAGELLVLSLSGGVYRVRGA